MPHELKKFSLLFLVMVIAIFLQIGGLVEFWNVIPNLILVLLVLFGLLDLRWGTFIALLAAGLAVVWFRVPFWFLELAPFFVVSVVLRLLRGKLTGNLLLDYSSVVALTSVLYSVAFSYRALSWALAVRIGGDII